MSFSAQHIRDARLKLRKRDPILGAVIKQVGPFTAKAKRDRFGTLVRSIVSQQIATAAARAIQGRVEAAVQERRETPVQRGKPFCAETLNKFTVQDLRDLGLSNQKANYVLDLSKHVIERRIDLRSIHKLDDEEIIESLIQIKGIGRWTAQMFLIFSLARMDVLPVDDLGIKTAIRNLYELEELPTKTEIETMATPWRPFASIASWYLWRSLELE